MEYDTTLDCPGCGCNNLHLQKVDAYCREEDAETKCVSVEIDTGKTELDNNFFGNPSSRRGAVTLSFMCEQCAAAPVLVIAQHKGSEFIYWRVSETKLVGFQNPKI